MSEHPFTLSAPVAAPGAAPLPISLVIPCRNEAANLELLLPLLAGLAEELLIVDGHSTDATAELAAAHGARHVLDNRKGKGDGLRVGLEHATREVVVFMDADLSHDPADIPRLVRPILDGEADLVLGSRMRGGGDEFVATFEELVRLAGNMGLTWLINLRCGMALSDSQNGFRAARTSLLRSLALRSDKHTIETEITMRAGRKGARVAEVATHEYPRKFGRSSLSIRKQGLLLAYTYLRECVRPV
jgi:glycosyltransferase involved in cell wall biosynthesis